MPETSPWDSLSVPNADFNTLQVNADLPVSCFWGKDSTGACLFLVDLEGDHTGHFRKDRVVVNGLSVDLRSGKAGHQRLVLALDKKIDQDLFESLCNALVVALRHASNSTSALAVALAHLKRWKLFLSGRGGQHLSDEAVRGLFAELAFLQELIGKLGPDGAVEAWLGPERSHQDFIFGNSAIEIKSLSGAERSEIRISSEDQLEALNDNLYLRIYRLSAFASAGATSLNDMVETLQVDLTTAEARMIFDQKLVAHGYAPLIEYDEPGFNISEIRSYRVTGEFPRLVRSELSEGVGKVTYSIRLEALEGFRAENSSVFGEN